MVALHSRNSSSLGSAGFSLAEAQAGHSYLIISSSAEDRDRMRIDSLGLIPGEVVHVLFSNYSGLIIAVKGSRLALGRPLAGCLTVQKLEDDDWPNRDTS